MKLIEAYSMADDLDKFHPGGHQDLLDIAAECSEPGAQDGTHETSREDLSEGELWLPFRVVSPEDLIDKAPWLVDWYRGPLLEVAREFAGTNDLVVSEDPANFPLINIHQGWNEALEAGESYESHIDSNPVAGLYHLGYEDRNPQTGGALVISNQGDVPSREATLGDCTRYYPKVGEFAAFNGYKRTHFVEPSVDGHDRVMIVCNFWTPKIPESNRAPGLAKGYDLGRTAVAIERET